MKNQWFKFVIVYVMWAAYIGLGVLFLIISRNSLTLYLQLYYIQNTFQQKSEANLINQVSFLVTALILVVLMIVVEEYFKSGVKKNVLVRRGARVFGIEIFFFFLASLAWAALTGFSTLVTLPLIFEFLISGLLLWLGYKPSPGILKNKL